MTYYAQNHLKHDVYSKTKSSATTCLIFQYILDISSLLESKIDFEDYHATQFLSNSNLAEWQFINNSLLNIAGWQFVNEKFYFATYINSLLI